MNTEFLRQAKSLIGNRYVDISIQLDTNRINAKGNLQDINILEKWRSDGIILMDMSFFASLEARNGGDEKRAAKVRDYIHPIPYDSNGEKYRKIEAIIFPKGAKDKQQRYDVAIALAAACYNAILVTNDGCSKRQPGGLLGNAKQLEKILKITVMRGSEVVELVNKKILARDAAIKEACEVTGLPVPEWVGKDMRTSRTLL